MIIGISLPIHRFIQLRNYQEFTVSEKVKESCVVVFSQLRRQEETWWRHREEGLQRETAPTAQIQEGKEGGHPRNQERQPIPRPRKTQRTDGTVSRLDVF